MSRGTASVVAFLLLLAGCNTQTTPTGPVLIQLVPTRVFSGSFRTFAFAQSPDPVQESTRLSAFRLYDNGAFSLDYPAGSYGGTYSDTNGSLVFTWDAGSAAGSWGATGSISGDLLTVRYNTIMSLSDFEDATYRLVR
jgi:hypothetical protein